VTSELVARRRKSFVLHLQGYTYGAIGELLGVSDSTVGNDVAWIEAEQARLATIQPRWLMEDGP
jgi:DNA-directed RNA polymerase specialized sigma24 family protein